MSNVQTETRTVIEHRFIVPCEEPHGGVFADLNLALHYARTKAAELDVDTAYDDWCRLHVEDEVLVIVVVETREGK